MHRSSRCVRLLAVGAVFLLGWGRAGVLAQVTDGNGYVLDSAWLALGPFMNTFGCTGVNSDILANHIAPSFIHCQYPVDGDEVPYDPSRAAAMSYHAAAPRGPNQLPIWRPYGEVSFDCDLNHDADLAGDIDDHVLFTATYVEVLNAPLEVTVCANSDDGVQVWVDGTLVINDNACRGRGDCTAGACDSTGTITLSVGVHRILMGIWERSVGWGGSLALIDTASGLRLTDSSPNVLFLGPESNGHSLPCVVPPERTITVNGSCPNPTSLGVRIRQAVPTGANPNEVVTVREEVRGSFGAARVAAANGGVVVNIPQRPISAVGAFGDWRAVITQPDCTGLAGEANATFGGGSYTLENIGADIWQTGDTFTFAYNRVQGDFVFTTHISNRIFVPGSRWGKHGAMVRQDLTNRSRYSFMHDHGEDPQDATRWATRPTHGGGDNYETTVLPGATHHDWLRVERIGNTFNGYSSPDGTNFTFTGTQNWGADAPAAVLVGLAATSHTTNCNDSPMAITFDQATLTGGTIQPAQLPEIGARITWNVTRQQLATGVSYTIDLDQGLVTMSGDVAGLPTAGDGRFNICPRATQPTGLINDRQWLALGPFNQPNGCNPPTTLFLANHIAPSRIDCQYPRLDDEIDYDPMAGVTTGYMGPPGPDGGPIWRQFDDRSDDGNLDFNIGQGNLDNVMGWIATWIEYTGPAPLPVELCIGSDDANQVWIDNVLVFRNNSAAACRGVAPCQDLATHTLAPGVHCVKVGVWDGCCGWGAQFSLRRQGGVPITGDDPDFVFHGTQPPPGFIPPECSSCDPEPVSNLTCVRGPVGFGQGVVLNWTNPPIIDLQTPTRIEVNGAPVATVPADATTAGIPNSALPPGNFSIAVVHCGGVPAFCSLFHTDLMGFIRGASLSVVGPFSNTFGCNLNNEDLLGNHIAPSHIACLYPQAGDEIDYDPQDPNSVSLGHVSVDNGRNVGPGGLPLVERFDDNSPEDGDQDLDAHYGDQSNVNAWMITYVQYTGALPVDIFLCFGSDDGGQVWFNDTLVHNNNACRGRGACQDRVPVRITADMVAAGGHIRIAAAAWEAGVAWGLSLQLQRADATPIVDPDPVWKFFGTTRPIPAEQFACTLPQPPIENLTCERNAQGGIELEWTNPPEGALPIAITVNGAEVAMLPASASNHTVPAAQLPPGGTARICVDNGALRPVCCGVATGNEVYVNCGGPAFTDAQGRAWSEDTLLNPSPFLTSQNIYVGDFGMPGLNDVSADPDVASRMFPQEIFSTERWNDGPVEYTVNGLGPGTYEVALLFMEGCCNDGGCNDDPAMDVECRRFDVVVNGTTVEAAFSQVLRASEITGNTPDAASYRVAVSLVAEASLAAGEPLEIQIVDLGAGNPPENAAIKAVAVVPAGGPPLRVFHRGDTTGEGNINITDGVGVFNWLFLGGTTPGCIEAANANDGATVNITSGVYLLNFLFLGGPAPPPPGPPGPGSVCGPDPVGSPSNLGCQTYNGC